MPSIAQWIGEQNRAHARVLGAAGQQLSVPSGWTSLAPRWRHVVEADELSIAVYRRVGDRETWLAIANDSQNVEVSLESAARLSGELVVQWKVHPGLVPSD